MRSSFTTQTGLKLARTPTAREQSLRRRLLALAAILALALVSGLLGVFTVPNGPIEPASRTGPFSYFPS
jgi:hypothetical protein